MLTSEILSPVLLSLLACPDDQSALSPDGDKLVCSSCKRYFSVIEGIPVFITENDSASKDKRHTKLFEESEEYFARSFNKRVNEWGVIPFMSETFKPADGWALDVGCGPGTLTLLNAKRGISSIGIDISLHGARFGSHEAKKWGLKNCFFVVGDAAHLPFRSGAFNLTTNYTAIEHIYDPGQCLKEMNRIVNPAGRIIVNTVNNFSFQTNEGVFKGLINFIKELFKYFFKTHSHHHEVEPTIENWKQGKDVDIYHSLSYELLKLSKKSFDVSLYTTHAYPHDGIKRVLTKELTVQEQKLSLWRKLFYRCIHLFDHVPVFRHMGRTVTIQGHKRFV